MKKIFFLLLFSAGLPWMLPAQNSKTKVPRPPVKITQEQMFEDYDQFVRIIQTYNPQWEIRKEHTGYDLMALLKEKREEIGGIKNYWKFIDFMDCSLSCLRDVHASRREVYHQAPHPRYAPGQSFYDSTAIAAIARGMEAWEANQMAHVYYKDFLQSMNSKYIDGHYYLRSHFTFKDARSGDSICFQNARVIACGHLPVDLYAKNLFPKLPPYRIRWDFTRQKYYTDLLMMDYNQTLKVEDETGAIYEFIPNHYRISRQTFEDKTFRENPDLYFSRYTRWEPQGVAYLLRERILYIHTDRMSWQTNYDLIEDIKRIGTGKTIDKVVIDVRNNRGGGDEFWITMLSAIVKDTLHFEDEVALNGNEEVMAYFNAEYPPEMTREFKIQEIPLLGGKKMLVRKGGDYAAPDSNSLGYGGKIYLFQDKDTYSSGGSFTAVARQIPQLVSMGESTGLMAGFGLNPWGFQLKHSKYTFSFEPAIDLSGAEKWEDIFQCVPEIEVTPSLEEFNEYLLYRDILPLEEFLLKHDYLFQKVLEME